MLGHPPPFYGFFKSLDLLKYGRTSTVFYWRAFRNLTLATLWHEEKNHIFVSWFSAFGLYFKRRECGDKSPVSS